MGNRCATRAACSSYVSVKRAYICVKLISASYPEIAWRGAAVIAQDRRDKEAVRFISYSVGRGY